MTHTILILGASLRNGLRWAKHHIYSLLILAPIVIGITYATAARLADNINLRGLEMSFETSLLLAALFEICLIAMALTRTVIEVYHLRRPESYFEALPVSHTSHFHISLAIRLIRTSVVGLLVLLTRSNFLTGLPPRPVELLPLGLFVAFTSHLELFAALNWIHWGHKREKRFAVEAIATLLAGIVLVSLLLVDLFQSGGELLRRPEALLFAASLAMLYWSTRISHSRWHASDIEFAKRLGQATRRSMFGVRLFRNRFNAAVASQLARDLQLTLRAFSSSVYLVWALALLWLVLLITALSSDFVPYSIEPGGWLDTTWLPGVMAVKVVCVLLVLTLAGLLPVLVAFELPHMWLERAAGTTGLDIWTAKLWYARLVSLPAPLATWLMGNAAGSIPGFYSLPLLVECAGLWWLSSSIMGALSFELPARPVLAALLMIMLGGAAGVLTAMAWPIGLLIYAQAMYSLTDRGRHRARYYLIEGED